MIESYKFYKKKKVPGEVLDMSRVSKLILSIKLETDEDIEYTIWRTASSLRSSLLVVLDQNNYIEINKKILTPKQTKKLLCNRFHKNRTRVTDYYQDVELRKELQ